MQSKKSVFQGKFTSSLSTSTIREMPKRYCAMEYEASEGKPTTRSTAEADRTERITTVGAKGVRVQDMQQSI